MITLSGDIGGTKTRLALVEVSSNRAKIQFEKTFPSREYSGLTEIVRRFLSEIQDKPTSAGLGVAGPVIGRQCKTTNLPWQIDAGELEVLLNIPQISLINDLEAIAWGIPALTEDQLFTLQHGTGDGTGNQLVIAAGTGLGQAGLYWDGAQHHPFASEGGHCDFAPSTELEFGLLQFLQQRYSHVSWERVASGQGLANIYDFLIEHHQQTTPAWLSEQFSKGDKSAIISSTASADSDPICTEALNLWVKLYGAEAGNHALKLMAKGGVYLAGGIPPKILEWLKQPLFVEAFQDKGRMSDLMASMPIRVILDDRCGLYGPARYMAERHPGGSDN
ncbi:MAG: glucokinase [Chromatiales bacterium]|nr:glucokinase [Chromatiales bacterium]